MSGWTCTPHGVEHRGEGPRGVAQSSGLGCKPPAPSAALTRLPGALSGPRETDLHCTRSDGSREASRVSWPV